MTGKERDNARIEWLKTVKEGNDVILTNHHCMMMNLFGSFFGKASETAEVCTREKIRGVLSDGSIIVGDKVYNNEGRELPLKEFSVGEPVLTEPTEDLINLAARYEVINTAKKVQWELFSDDALNQLTKLLVSESNRIRDERETREKEKKEQEEKKKEEKKNSSIYVDTESVYANIEPTDVISRANIGISSDIISSSLGCSSEKCANYKPNDTWTVTNHPGNAQKIKMSSEYGELNRSSKEFFEKNGQNPPRKEDN
jgi:hypothetical protein